VPTPTPSLMISMYVYLSWLFPTTTPHSISAALMPRSSPPETVVSPVTRNLSAPVPPPHNPPDSPAHCPPSSFHFPIHRLNKSPWLQAGGSAAKPTCRSPLPLVITFHRISRLLLTLPRFLSPHTPVYTVFPPPLPLPWSRRVASSGV